MSWSPLVLIELVLVGGVVFGWGGRELWLLRKDRREAQRRRGDDAAGDDRR